MLFQLDGKIPNIALMRISSHHKAIGDAVDFRWGGGIAGASNDLFDRPDKVYASLIFEKTKPVAERLLTVYPDAVLGGTGWEVSSSLEAVGITTPEQDYTLYPKWSQSIGFTQRGCRLKCPFCVVPRKEGGIKDERSISEIWRGDPWPKQLLLLDNDFFGHPNWNKRIEEIRAGAFKVSFCQGINARFLTDETSSAIASIDYRDDQMTRKCIYTAWDNAKDEARLFAGLESLVKHGVNPKNITVYILLGYWPWSGLEDWEFRRAKLREFGAVPYPMPFERNRETIGFQRWVIGAYDKAVPWRDWVASGYYPNKLGLRKAVGQIEMES